MGDNMTNVSGWTDSSGATQSGFPPPGYWQASDGRWYPPQPPSQGWADRAGVTHPGAAPPGYWQANDGRWYPPQQQVHSGPIQAARPTLPSERDQQGKKPIWKRWWFVSAVGVLLLLIVAGALASPEEDSADAAPTSDQVDTTEVVTTESSELIASPTTESVATTQPPSTTTTAPAWDAFTVTGSGDDIVELSVPGSEPAIVELDHSGSRNFSVITYTASGQRIDLLANDIGVYNGRHGINFIDGESVGELEVSADGAWSAIVTPLRNAESITTTYQGSGDDVILFAGSGSRMTLTHEGESNFAVIGWSESGRDLLVNEIGLYSGTVRLDSGTILFTVTADGAWSMTVE